MNEEFQVPKINSCLINKYPCGENFIAPHRDSAISFGEKPTIIGLSIGNERKIDFVRNDKTKVNDFSFDLESGSLFIMAGSSQKYYQHSIPKEYCENVRYSFTFREFIL
jgi:alkylated DNA repair dioxygenase AlkB